MKIIPFWRVRWFIAITRVGIKNIYGGNSFESSENDLKILADRYGVRWHKFNE